MVSSTTIRELVLEEAARSASLATTLIGLLLEAVASTEATVRCPKTVTKTQMRITLSLNENTNTKKMTSPRMTMTGTIRTTNL